MTRPRKHTPEQALELRRTAAREYKRDWYKRAREFARQHGYNSIEALIGALLRGELRITKG